MQNKSKVQAILNNYSSDSPGVITNLARILNHGVLGGTGRLVILPVDQGFEHGPAKSFAMNPQGYDPLYHPKLALEAGLNAYAAPLGMIEACAREFAHQIPLILKLNSSNSLNSSELPPDQAITGSIKDALRLGCVGIGLTIYPGSAKAGEMIEEAKQIISEAKAHGLIAVVWSYPRGSISKQGETATDIVAYAAHIAALIGAHIIKVKPPQERIEIKSNESVYTQVPINTLKDRVAHVMQASFASKRIVVFSGGANKNKKELLNEIKEIRDGGGNGSIIGRNTFQRERNEALSLLSEILSVYKESV